MYSKHKIKTFVCIGSSFVRISVRSRPGGARIASLLLLLLEALDGGQALLLHSLLARFGCELHLLPELAHRPQLARLLLPLGHILLLEETLANLKYIRK